jgi:hypothetical protein
LAYSEVIERLRGEHNYRAVLSFSHATLNFWPNSLNSVGFEDSRVSDVAGGEWASG